MPAIMSDIANMNLADYHHGNSKDAFPSSLQGHTSSGFLTPASSAFEGRRDSLASLQSSISYCQSFGSDFSGSSDVTMPMTPCSGRSPVVDQTVYANWMAHHDTRTPINTAFPTLPLRSQSKTINYGDSSSNGADWVMVQRPEGSSFNDALHFESNDILPSSSDFGPAVHTFVTPRPGSEELAYTTSESSWSNMSTTAWDGANGQFSNHLGQRLSMVPSTLHWQVEPELPMSEPHEVLPNTTPNEPMMDVEDSFVQVSLHSDGFDTNINPYGACTPPYSRSPQDVRLKIEGHDESSDDIQMEANNCHLPSDRKSSRRERRNGLSSRRKAKVEKRGKFPGEYGDILIPIIGKKHKLPCHLCPKKFERPEHLKRHVDTHSGERPFACQVPECNKRFNRKDNRDAHHSTHVEIPNKKNGRNPKKPIEEIKPFLVDTKSRDKLQKDYDTEIAKLTLKIEK